MQNKNHIKTSLKEFINEDYCRTPPTFERIKNMDGLKGFSNDDYKIVRFAYDDEGGNGFALLDLKKGEIVSWSISGSSERDRFLKSFNTKN